MLLDLQATTKEAAIDEMINSLVDNGVVTDFDVFKAGIMAREAQTSTGLGDGIAMPHSKNAAVKEATVLFAKSNKGVDYESLDGQPTDLFFMIAAPEGANDTHLAALAELSKYLMQDGFADRLRKVTSPDEVIAAFNTGEEEAQAEEAKKAQAVKEAASSDKPLIVAVTACTTGIAHTYMAEESLIKTGEEMGVNVRVETNGASGVGTPLTAEEISKAVGVIVAADKAVETARFDGKKLLSKPVAAGIRQPQELIQNILDGKAEVFHAENAGAAQESSEKLSLGGAFYKHLMSGVSQMLPFVIGGGIMIALAFLLDQIMGVPKDQLSHLGSYNELPALFKSIGDIAFSFMLPILAGYIAYSIADRPGLAVGFTGGLLAANGNAVLAKYVFANESLGGFSKFISNFAFVGENGGNTVSGFLGGIAAGFVAGFIVLGLKKLCSKLPDSLEGIKPTLIYPLVGIFLIGILMTMVFNPLIGLINTGLSNMLTSISDAGMITVLGLILGAMMAIDMGGPINKAAYVFGSGMLATASQMMAQGAQASDPAVQACYMAMASIMVGGMVPPVGIAAACKLFPRKFTKAEQGSAVSNIVMGCSFITEGAIPFAASDPLHVIPCTMAGAGVAGLLSALFGCTLMAPHGGVFVFATVGQPLLYIVAWLVGSAVTAVMLGFIKKDAKA